MVSGVGPSVVLVPAHRRRDLMEKMRMCGLNQMVCRCRQKTEKQKSVHIILSFCIRSVAWSKIPFLCPSVWYLWYLNVPYRTILGGLAENPQ